MLIMNDKGMQQLLSSKFKIIRSAEKDRQRPVRSGVMLRPELIGNWIRKC